MSPFLRNTNPQALVVGMVGVKLGEQLAHIGCAHGGRLGAVAAKVGLSGRAVAIVPDAASATRAAKGAADAGVLVEVETAPPTNLPLDEGAFDLATIDDTGGVLTAMSPGDRDRAIREVLRILRPGGRLIVIGRGAPTGISAWLHRERDVAAVDTASELQAGGFKAVRTLADREGLRFIEGIKPRSQKSEV
jgi:ubiquinone/menaquinone biosynthesis C-methylase UbiE